MSMTIDLNSDLGEHTDPSPDRQIMPFISSCNIACGGHFGNADSIRRTIALAMEHKVAIGAHPSFPDREHFGRKPLKMDPQQLRDSLTEQILLVRSLAEEAGHLLHHVKPHGALYNLAAVDRPTALLIADCLLSIGADIRLYVLAHSIMEEVAKEKKVRFVREAFADRRYEPDQTLRSRKHADAVIHDEAEVLKQVGELTFRNRTQVGGNWLTIKAETICLHSDTKGALNLAKAIHEYLVGKGATITSV